MTMKFERYEDLIQQFAQIEIMVALGEAYEGDAHLLLKSLDGKRLGFLYYGWGSCSGCDAFEACYSPEDFWNLRCDLERSVQWFDTPAELRAFLEARDWKGCVPRGMDAAEQLKSLFAYLDKPGVL
jgi:hypothetical protein